MRVMVFVHATEDSEKGDYAGHADEFEAMGKYNEELVQAGVMLAGEGLEPSAHGKLVDFAADGAGSRVIDGPFAEAKEVIGGFWIWQVSSMEEAVPVAAAGAVPRPAGGAAPDSGAGRLRGPAAAGDHRERGAAASPVREQDRGLGAALVGQPPEQRSEQPPEQRSEQPPERPSEQAAVRRTVDAVWRIESARLIAALARVT